MRLVVPWLREFADVPADPTVVASRLAACGFAAESIDGDTIDFEVTANRPDAMSVVGLAREARTAFRVGTPAPRPPAQHATNSAAGGPRHDAGTVTVRLDSPLCRRYALAMADVQVAPSPAWLSDRLTAAGVRPINAVVDVTNYVMLETGQPMHAFDAAQLAGATLTARLAKPGERLTTLDGETRTLAPSMLVIADRDHAVAVAGVMGGRASEVSERTTRVAIESAYFDPATVRRASKRLGLKTEASTRFERGADIGSPVHALERVLSLLDQIGAGRATGAIVDVFPAPPAPAVVGLTRGYLDRLVGASIPDADVERILRGLGFELTTSPGGWGVTVPTFRVDVLRETDLVEEVARHWGFDHIPGRPPLETAPPSLAGGVAQERRLTGLLSGAGLQEAVTFTFMERAAAEPFASADEIVSIANPLSEKFAVLRPSILPGLLDALVYNRRREAKAVRLFEIGSIFSASGEATRLGWVITGPRFDHWSGHEGSADFFDAKGVAELVATSRRQPIEAVGTDTLPWYVPGRAARLVAIDDPRRPVVGHVGEIRPDLVAARGLESGRVFAGEFSVDARILAAGSKAEPHAVTPIPRMPSVVRDLSILVSESLPAAQVRATIWADPPPALVDVREFDRYQGKGVPAGSVSLSLRLTFRDPNRTLTDIEVQVGVDRIVGALARAHRAVIRGGAGSQSE